MKFSCDQCHAQYMIADEKVGERGVKVKCKKCQHVIIVRPKADEEPEAPAPGMELGNEAGVVAPPSPGVDAGGADGGFDSQDTSIAHGSAAADPSSEFQPPGAGSFGDGFGLGADQAPGGGVVGGEAGAPAGFDSGDPGAGADLGALGMAPGGVDAGFSGGEAERTEVAVNVAAMQAAAAGDANLGHQFGTPEVGFGEQAYGEQSDGEAQQADGGQMGGAFDSLFGGHSASTPAQESTAGTFSAPAAAGEKEWYVAIDDSQVGPVDVAEIEQRWDGRDLNEDSLAWKAGMDDWLPIADIPELAYLVTERPQRQAGAFEQQGAAGYGGGMGAMATGGDAGGGGSSSAIGPMSFGGGGEAPSDISWKPSAASALSSLVQEELVSETEPPAASPAPVPAGMPSFGPPGDLFGGPAAGAGNGGTAPPTFAAPATDGFAGGGAGFALPAPAPTSSGGGFKLAYLFFGFIGLAVLIVLGVLVVMMVNRPTTVVAQSGAPAPGQPYQGQPVPAQPYAGQPAAPVAPQPASRPAPPQEVAQAPEPDSSDSSAGSSARGGGRSGGKGGTKSGSKGGGKSGGRSGGKGGGKSGGDAMAGVFDKDVKEKLGIQDIVNGVKTNAGAVMPCLQKARSNGEIVPGTYKLILNWDINPNGSASNGRMTGPANVMGTSLPACFGRAMKKWKFPASKQGAPVKNFPFGPFTVK